MGRLRKKADQWLPNRVYKGKSAYEWRPKGTTKAIRLCDLNAKKSTVWTRYEQEKTTYNAISGSFLQLSNDYQQSTQYKDLANRTQKDYSGYSKKICSVFGKMNVNAIKPEHVRKYMDIRGKTSKIQANRESAYMSTVCSWGFERGKIEANPCKGVKRFTEKPRSRYITDAEYQAVHDNAPLSVQIAMEISYLCAARKNDILNLTKNKLTKEGIYIKQGKTGKEQIKLWNKQLRKTVNQSKTISKVKSIYIIHKQDGTKYTDSGFNSIWDRARKKAAKALKVDKLDFTFHDIKAKSISDYQGDKKKFSGHKTHSQVAIYNRKIDRVDSHDPDKNQ
jgi:integrase